MCKSRNSTPAWMTKDRVIRVDHCLTDLIESLNELGVKTLSCCCGHDIYQPTVVIATVNDKAFEIVSGVEIPRKNRFYKKDANGFYYIPETMKKNTNPLRRRRKALISAVKGLNS